MFPALFAGWALSPFVLIGSLDCLGLSWLVKVAWMCLFPWLLVFRLRHAVFSSLSVFNRVCTIESFPGKCHIHYFIRATCKVLGEGLQVSQILHFICNKILDVDLFRSILVYIYLSHFKCVTCWKKTLRQVSRNFLCETGKPVVSIQTQAVKLHKHFVHFKYSLRVNKKNSMVNIFVL